MAEDAEPSESGDNAETVEIPLSAFPQPPEPNATIQLKVISVDADNGVVNATVIQGNDGGGSDDMAKEFDQPKQ